MKTSELLDELQGNILRDVSNAVTGEGATLWTPSSLVRYLDDAQVKMAVETMCIVDASTVEVTDIVLQDGVSVYPLHTSVLTVESVRYDDRHDGRRLKKATTWGLEDGTDQTTMSLPIDRLPDTGPSKFYALDEETGQIRVYPTPSAKEVGVTLYLRVIRKPLAPLTLPLDGQPETDITPEVPSEYHLDLCEWAAYRALRNHDVDAENIPKATSHRNQWNRVIAMLKKRVRRTRQVPATFGVRVNN